MYVWIIHYLWLLRFGKRKKKWNGFEQNGITESALYMTRMNLFEQINDLEHDTELFFFILTITLPDFIIPIYLFSLNTYILSIHIPFCKPHFTPLYIWCVMVCQFNQLNCKVIFSLFKRTNFFFRFGFLWWTFGNISFICY